MKLKSRKAVSFGVNELDSLNWNADGSINRIETQGVTSENLNATYVYENGRIAKAFLRYNDADEILDTVFYHYNTNGKVDSIYLKDGFLGNYSLSYTAGKLTKLAYYMQDELLYYWEIGIDGNENITTATRWGMSASGFKKEVTYTYTRDDRKNPYHGLDPYMYYLNYEYIIFERSGLNNAIDKKESDPDNPEFDIVLGSKYKYNGNCYPASSQNTLGGIPIGDEDDYTYTYY